MAGMVIDSFEQLVKLSKVKSGEDLLYLIFNYSPEQIPDSVDDERLKIFKQKWQNIENDIYDLDSLLRCGLLYDG